MNVPNQENLIQQARSGDAVAFETLVNAYYPLILNFSYRLLGNRADAEDVTQDVFVKAAKKLSSLRKPGVFNAWLYSIARSTCTDLIRKRSRQKINEQHYVSLALRSLRCRRIGASGNWSGACRRL